MTLEHPLGSQAKLGGNTWSQPPVAPQSPCSRATSPHFPKLEGVAFKGALMGVTKQIWAAGWDHATPHVDNSDLCALSLTFKNYKGPKKKKKKKHWEFTGAVLGQKRIGMFGFSTLFPPLWKGEPAACYVSLDFNTFRSLQRKRRLQWKICWALILAWCRSYHLTWAVEKMV